MDWIGLSILVLNTVITILTNMDVNRKRAQSRIGD